jgi:hypothetical protein
MVSSNAADSVEQYLAASFGAGPSDVNHARCSRCQKPKAKAVKAGAVQG